MTLRRAGSGFALLLTFLLSGCLLYGCLAMSPGRQAREGVSQWTEFGWDELGTTYDAQGPQAAAVELGEGEIYRNPDGSIDFKRSVFTRFARYTPSADVAGRTTAAGFNASTEQWAEFYRTLPAFVPFLSMISGAQPPAPAGAAGGTAGAPAGSTASAEAEALGNLEDMLADVLGRLDALEGAWLDRDPPDDSP